MTTNVKQSGQVVIMLLLIMVVVLTIGLSIAARSTTDVGISTLTEQSSRAFAAAEAGLEQALKDPSNGILLTGLTSNVGEGKFSVIQVAQAGPRFAFPGGVVRDDPIQVWLSNYPDLSDLSLTGKPLRIYWGQAGTSYNCNATDPKAPALEYTYIYSSGGTYSTTHGFFDGCGSLRSGASGFSAPESGSYTLTTNLGDQTYQYRTPEFTLSGNPKLLRVRLLYNDTAVPVAVESIQANLPQQGSLLESTGEYGDTKRKIQVFRSYPRLPGIFDYVLFAGGSVTK